MKINDNAIPSWQWTEHLGHDPSDWKYHHSVLYVLLIAL
jgi:hypothetical protein